MIALLGASMLAGCASAIGMAEDQIFVETEASTSNIDMTADLDAITADKIHADATSSQAESRTEIKLCGDSASLNGSGVTIKESSITISASGEYEVPGTLKDGSIIVNVEKRLTRG